MQSKRPRFNPLILALALAAVLMVWSVLGGTGSASSSSMEYSTVVHYFESLQVTQFSLDLNTGVITMNLKEGGLSMPGAVKAPLFDAAAMDLVDAEIRAVFPEAALITPAAGAAAGDTSAQAATHNTPAPAQIMANR